MNEVEKKKLEHSKKNIKLFKTNENNDGLVILNSANNEIDIHRNNIKNINISEINNLQIKKILNKKGHYVFKKNNKMVLVNKQKIEFYNNKFDSDNEIVNTDNGSLFKINGKNKDLGIDEYNLVTENDCNEANTIVKNLNKVFNPENPNSLQFNFNEKWYETNEYKKVENVIGKNILFGKINEVVFCNANYGIWFSNDGINWKKSEGNSVNKKIIEFIKFKNIYFARCEDTSIYYSENGYIWEELSNGSHRINGYYLSADESSIYFYNTTNKYVYKFENNTLSLINQTNEFRFSNNDLFIYKNYKSINQVSIPCQKCDVGDSASEIGIVNQNLIYRFNQDGSSSFLYSIPNFKHNYGNIVLYHEFSPPIINNLYYSVYGIPGGTTNCEHCFLSVRKINEIIERYENIEGRLNGSSIMAGNNNTYCDIRERYSDIGGWGSSDERRYAIYWPNYDRKYDIKKCEFCSLINDGNGTKYICTKQDSFFGAHECKYSNELKWLDKELIEIENLKNNLHKWYAVADKLWSGCILLFDVTRYSILSIMRRGLSESNISLYITTIPVSPDIFAEVYSLIYNDVVSRTWWRGNQPVSFAGKQLTCKINCNNETISLENKKKNISKLIDINLLNNNFDYIADYSANPQNYTIYKDSDTSYHLVKTSGVSNTQFNPNYIFDYKNLTYFNMNNNLYIAEANNKLTLFRSNFGTIKKSHYIKETDDVLLLIGNNLYSMNKSSIILNDVNEICEIKLFKDSTYIFYNTTINNTKVCILKQNGTNCLTIDGNYLCYYKSSENDNTILIGTTTGLYSCDCVGLTCEKKISGNINVIKERNLNNDTSIYAIDKVNHKIYKSSKTNAGALVFEEFEKSSVKYKNFDVVNPIKDFISESETDENDEIRYKGRRKLFTNMN